MPKTKSKKQKKVSYSDQVEKFFKDHPYSRLLIGLFIVATVIMVGMRYYRFRVQVDVGNYLWDHDGIIYRPEL